MYFDQSSYTITEGEGPLEVCVAIDEELGVTVDITLSSKDSTAKGINMYNTYSIATILMIFLVERGVERSTFFKEKVLCQNCCIGSFTGCMTTLAV